VKHLLQKACPILPAADVQATLAEQSSAYLRVAQIEEAHAAMQKAHEGGRISEVQDRDWKMRQFYVWDPNRQSAALRPIRRSGQGGGMKREMPEQDRRRARRPGLCRAGLALMLAALASALGGGPARAKSCTVDLDEVKIIRKEILDLVKGNLRVDGDRAAAVKRKYGDALKGGPLTLDPNDFKGLLSLKGKPSPAAIQDLLGRVQSIIASCQ